MKENTLGVKEMKVMKTSEFDELFIGKSVTFWIGKEPIYFGLFVLEIEVSDIGGKECIVFFGESNNDKFAVEFGYGFGIKVKGERMHYWVDSMNRDEATVIVYEISEP